MMKRTRFAGMFLCLALMFAMVLPTTAYAASTPTIDVSSADEGYFTVNYGKEGDARMKIGVKFGSATKYSDYVPGTEGKYSFSNGNGSYTLTLYQNISGTSYRQITSKSVKVEIEDELSRYLLSTSEVTFAEGDEVSTKAAEICKDLDTDAEKALALYRFIADNFTYSYDFAAKILKGEIKSYIPNTTDILSAKTGVCYDFSALYAAMCRSQKIPCSLVKGTYAGGSHAWNSVFVNDTWYTLDLTYAIQYKAAAADTLAESVSPLTSYSVGFAA